PTCTDRALDERRIAVIESREHDGTCRAAVARRRGIRGRDRTVPVEARGTERTGTRRAKQLEHRMRVLEEAEPRAAILDAVHHLLRCAARKRACSLAPPGRRTPVTRGKDEAAARLHPLHETTSCLTFRGKHV